MYLFLNFIIFNITLLSLAIDRRWPSELIGFGRKLVTSIKHLVLTPKGGLNIIQPQFKLIVIFYFWQNLTSMQNLRATNYTLIKSLKYNLHNSMYYNKCIISPTFAMATAGNVSQSNCSSSPVLPSRWPLNILEAVNVDAPIPSPTKNTTFFARPILPS